MANRGSVQRGRVRPRGRGARPYVSQRRPNRPYSSLGGLFGHHATRARGARGLRGRASRYSSLNSLPVTNANVQDSGSEAETENTYPRTQSTSYSGQSQQESTDMEVDDQSTATPNPSGSSEVFSSGSFSPQRSANQGVSPSFLSLTISPYLPAAMTFRVMLCIALSPRAKNIEFEGQYRPK